MAYSQDYLDFILDQLSGFGDVMAKKMFGGIGFFKGGTMFAMIGGDVFRMRVDDVNRADYETLGMKPYQPHPNKKGMPYWEVPLSILEDRESLTIWAEKAYAAALRGKKKK
ncbi:MAG: hypothetical protein DWQ02_15805 [Bacteroidetes bacterium]|nr:MAG: hypothetical protein DWQ02_15805 [Bacteroidota bacterium]